MSDCSDTHSFAPILPRSSCENQGEVGLPPALSEVSPKDKPWDKHRKNADTVSAYYQLGDMPDYARRVSSCSQLLDFRLVPESEQGEYKLKLSAAFFCRVRHCPVCQWRRSLQWKARAYQALPRVVADYPKARWLFVTLTMKNCAVQDLREALSHLNKSFKRLTELKVFPALGWVKSVEVTRGRDGKTAHPHLHCLLMVKPSFFSRNYIKKKEWIALWQKCLRVDYKPVLDVQAVKPKDSPVGLVSEVLKYATKESDLVADPYWFAEYVRQVHRTRAVSVGGVLRGYFRDLEREPDDLIGKDEEGEGQLDEGHLYFGWKRREQRYRNCGHSE